MKNLLFLFLLALIINFSYGQSVSGKVQDPEGKPLPFANVLLINSTDSILVKGTVTAENGIFNIESVAHGSYLTAISMVGYKKTYSELFTISANHPDQRFPIFTVEVEDQQLNEVTIEAQKPLYEKQIDRLVVNVQQSITAAGNSVLEVLQKSPGININRQNLSIIMNGKSGVTVMINNKIARLPIDAVLQMLDGMSAANVEKIELITNPPAKYEAEGSAGIIHIVMLENSDHGTNGNFGITAGMNGAETFGTNFNINHRRKNISFFADYSILYDHNKHATSVNMQITKPEYISQFYSTSQRIPFTTIQNFRAGTEISLTKKTTAGSLITLYQRHWKMKSLAKIENQITKDSSRHALISIGELNRWQSFIANFNLNHVFNNKNTIRFDLDFLNYHNYQPSYYNNNFYFPENNLSTFQKIDIRK
ncbi:hypothetical protein BH23BAC1_BH23BAC1_31290 [soil metagenome]